MASIMRVIAVLLCTITAAEADIDQIFVLHYSRAPQRKALMTRALRKHGLLPLTTFIT